jgi:hypothetical protein
MPRLQAQVPDPGAAQDAESAREKLLKASDELDNVQANSEATKASVDGMKADMTTLQQTITKLQGDNAALKQQVADLQTALDNYKDEQLKARQKLIDDVAGMIAADKAGSSTKPAKKKKDADASTPDVAKTPDDAPASANLTPPPDTAPSTASTPAQTDETPPAPKPQKGYYHVVAFGETLTMIVAAYKDNGVNTSVAEIRKANGLAKDTPLKAGQKLFIPKPGT